MLARAFKDIFPRYKTMQGYYVLRRGGWDTHGLPVEIEVEKQLGLTGKQQIEEYGIAEFNAALPRLDHGVHRASGKQLTERMAFWVDLKTAYVTFHNEYVESLWWILKQFWEKDLLFQGYKIVPYCPRCGTPLSSHELSLGYKEGTIDPSVYVKFRVTDGEGRAARGEDDYPAGLDDHAVDAARQRGAGRRRRRRLRAGARRERRRADAGRRAGRARAAPRLRSARPR